MDNNRNHQSNDSLTSGRPGLHIVSLFASILAIIIVGLVLIGWGWDIDRFKRVVPGLVSMNPMTAIAFSLAAISLWLQYRPPAVPDQRQVIVKLRLAQLSALVILGIGLLRLGSYLFGWDMGIDQLLFRDKLATDLSTLSNRMAPNTALGFVFLGLALLLLDVTARRRHRPAETLAILVGLISLFGLIGYAYGIKALYGVTNLIPMALHTAVVFQILALGILCARPGAGFMAIATSSGPAGVLVGRLLPGLVMVLCGLGWLRLEGQRLGYFDSGTGLTLFTLANIVLFGLLIRGCAREFLRAEKARQRSELERNRFFEQSLGLFAIAGTDGFFKQINNAFVETLGYSQTELLR